LAGGGTIGLLAALQPIYLILGAQWMIVGEGGVTQVGASMHWPDRSAKKPWENLED
jgi:hypothetical protein